MINLVKDYLNFYMIIKLFNIERIMKQNKLLKKNKTNIKSKLSDTFN